MPLENLFFNLLAQCCGSGMFISDPTFFLPGSASKNLGILAQKQGFKALGNIIRVVHPGSESRIRILTFYPSRDPGVKKAPGPGSDPQHCVISAFVPVSAICNRAFQFQSV
jgi:hypothetical protein